MTSNAHPTCVVIGEGSFASRGLHVLLERMQVRGVVSPDRSLGAWARQNDVPHGTGRADLQRMLEPGVDYLFSLNNPLILRPEELERVRQRTVNYHDSPLPAYAGLHATSFALMAGEASHGITLHEVTPRIDAGDILVQQAVAVTPTDTAATLNAKCFQAALDAFEELVPCLIDGTVQPYAQPRSGASYHGIESRPPRAGILDFRWEAPRLDALLRSLDFGRTPNTLGLPKVRLPDGGVAWVEKMAFDPQPVDAPAGTVLSASRVGHTIATGHGVVTLRVLSTIGREAATLPEPGACLPLTEEDDAHASAQELARNEAFWCRRMGTGEGFDHPYARGHRSGQPRRLAVDFGGRDAMSLFLLYARRVVDHDELLLIGYSGEAQVGLDPALFSPFVPLRVPALSDLSRPDHEAEVRLECERTEKRRTFLRDLPARMRLDSPALPVRVQRGGPRPSSLPPGCDLLLWISAGTDGPDGDAEIIADEGRISGADLGHIASQLTALLADASPQVSRASLLLPGEQRAGLLDGAADGEETPGRLLHEAVLAHGETHPDAIAVKDAEQELTYAELATRARHVAHLLRARGIGPGQFVGIALERRVDLAVALLGTLQCGATYVPLDPHYPWERIRFIASDAGLGLLLTTRLVHRSFPLLDVPTFFLEEADASPVDPATAALPLDLDPESAAYVIYTSGSTGAPKGVLVPHRAVAHQVRAVGRVYDLTSSDRCLQVASLSFDLSVEELFAPWTVGATVVLSSPGLLESFDGFTQFCEDMGLSFLNLSTAFFQGWMDHLGRMGAPLPRPLRAVVVGTEAAAPRHLQLFLDRQAVTGRPVRWFNAYGLTETAITSTIHEHIGETVPDGPVPIGVPVSGTRVYVMDRRGLPRPVGLPGELWIGGRGVALGYLGHPKRTQERFVPDPLQRSAGARVYRTGDLVYRRDDGELVFLGREDDQVKVRGYRVELGEVEAALERHSQVAQAVVVARKTGAGSHQLFAYVLPGKEPPTWKQLAEHLESLVPAHVVPVGCVFLTEIPLTPNGKVDRRRLPEPPPMSTTDGPFEPPQGPIEERLATLFCATLGVQRAGRGDDFFALGGDSLKALELLGEVQRELSVVVPLSDLLLHPSLGALANHVEALSPQVAERSHEGKASLRTRMKAIAQRRFAGPPPFEPLVPIRARGSGRPFFCVTGTGGNVLVFRPLADALPSTRPFYAFQSCGVDGLHDPDPSIEAMAARNVRALRSQFPAGPYLLGGYSGGGVVAFEMARQLRAAGQEVRRLVVIDTDTGLVTPESTRDKVGRMGQGLREGGLRFLTDWARGRLAWERERRVLSAVRKTSRAFGQPIPVRFRHRLLEESWFQGRDQYVMGTYSGRVDLIRTAELRDQGVELGWDQVAGRGAVVHDMPGNHTTLLLAPLVASFAERLEAILRAADRTTIPPANKARIDPEDVH